MHQIWAQNNPYIFNFIINFNYSILFSICHNVTKRKELFSLKGTNKGRSPYNGRLSDFSFYIDSQISVHRKFKKNQLII